MRVEDVTLWGRDYSAREFTPEEFDRYQRENPAERPVQWLDRYIGYPGNSKCISHYPGMYRRHWESGRPVSLFHQIGYSDMEGGYNRGRDHAQVAKADAERVGWRGESHITACMDRFYAKQGYPTLTRAHLAEYMRGFRSVLGDRVGFYGFYDSMRDAISEGWASFYVQCGARSAHVPGIHAWQENNYQPRIFGTATDILELYCSWDHAFGGGGMSEQDARNGFTDAMKAAADSVRTGAPNELAKSFMAMVAQAPITNPFDKYTAPLTDWIVGTNASASKAAEKAVADIEEDKLAQAFQDLGVSFSGASPAQVKEAVAEALRSTRLSVETTGEDGK